MGLCFSHIMSSEGENSELVKNSSRMPLGLVWVDLCLPKDAEVLICDCDLIWSLCRCCQVEVIKMDSIQCGWYSYKERNT